MKKQQSTDKAKKNSRPVSEKFYQSLNERAIDAANVVGKPLLGVDVMKVVDAYINDGVQPSGHTAEVMLVFTLLKPEIDKAMSRSAAARKRCKRHVTETEPQTTISPSTRLGRLLSERGGGREIPGRTGRMDGSLRSRR
ncbi:MAG: hypothetical protein NC212_03280 [Staphylococcus sp.]|nr:hypothetical protein [Staphylococcus sp.]